MPPTSQARLRVLHLNSMLKGGGTDDQCVKVAAGLRQLGHEVWLAGPDGRAFSKTVRELGIPFHATPSEGLLKSRFMISAARMVRRERIQIVHGHHGRDFWPTVLVARLSGVRPKIVLTRHLAKSPGSWVSRRFLLNRCDALIAVSEFVAKVLRDGDAEPASGNPERHYRPRTRGDYSKIRVVRGGADMSRFAPMDAAAQRQAWGLEAHHYAFAVAGGYSLPRGKGQPEFLQAAARIRSELPDGRFLIVGGGNMKAMLEAQIAKLGLSGVAWLTPYCNDMPAAMNAIDCLVHPQVGTEALGLVVCEAHACGKPVIASRLDGIPEAFAAASYGELIPPESVEALAQAMANWGRKPRLELLARWELHARVAERFSLERAAQDLSELYFLLLRDSSTKSPG